MTGHFACGRARPEHAYLQDFADAANCSLDDAVTTPSPAGGATYRRALS